jgi:hypothetical protein
MWGEWLGENVMCCWCGAHISCLGRGLAVGLVEKASAGDPQI